MSHDASLTVRDRVAAIAKRHEFGLTVGLVMVMVSTTTLGAGLAWEWALAVALLMGCAAGFAMIERP